MLQRTLCIIKPDAVARNLQGEILGMIQAARFKVAAMKMLHLSKVQAEGFYAVHRDRPFFAELTDYMCTGPVLCAVLEGEDAIARYRKLMGATDPAQAEEGTIRKKYALNLEANSVHGSDAPETAAFEISYFFSGIKIVA
jgi:nucleoside-diphosphate kinase